MLPEKVRATKIERRMVCYRVPSVEMKSGLDKDHYSPKAVPESAPGKLRWYLLRSIMAEKRTEGAGFEYKSVLLIGSLHSLERYCA
jgi:hypothetical protein